MLPCAQTPLCAHGSTSAHHDVRAGIAESCGKPAPTPVSPLSPMCTPSSARPRCTQFVVIVSRMVVNTRDKGVRAATLLWAAVVLGSLLLVWPAISCCTGAPCSSAPAGSATSRRASSTHSPTCSSSLSALRRGRPPDGARARDRRDGSGSPPGSGGSDGAGGAFGVGASGVGTAPGTGAASPEAGHGVVVIIQGRDRSRPPPGRGEGAGEAGQGRAAPEIPTGGQASRVLTRPSAGRPRLRLLRHLAAWRRVSWRVRDMAAPETTAKTTTSPSW